MRLRVILPLVGTASIESTYREVTAYTSPGTEVDVVSLETGARSVESSWDEVAVAPGVVERVVEAAAEGCDAVFVSCAADPGVHAARELVDIPVAGAFQPALFHALSLGESVSILQVLAQVRPMLWRLARSVGIESRIGSIQVIDMPVVELHSAPDLTERLVEAGRRAIEQDGADVLVLGCTGMLGVSAAVQKALADQGPYVPVVDSTAAAVLWLEAEVRMGLRPSRLAYWPREPGIRFP